MTDALIGLAVESSVRITLLAAAVALMMALLRARASTIRHSAWRAVLVAMLLMPLLSRIEPRVVVPIPPPFEPLMELAAPMEMASLPADAASTAVPAAAPGTAPSPAFLTPNANVAPTSTVSWPVLLLASYVAGVALFLLHLAAGFVHLWRIRRASHPVFADAFESRLVASPVTIGAFSPRVVLPVAWKQWPDDMLSAVLAHERAHAARRDPLIALLARINCALFWFHPVAWWLKRVLATTAEHACDDAAVTQVAGRRRYAEVLLEVARTVRRHRGRLIWQSAGVDGSGRLEQRINRVLHERPVPDPTGAQKLLVAVSCAAAMLSAIACSRERVIAPLRENPELAAELKARNELEAARRMTAEDAAALEASLNRNPDDRVAREKLVIYYGWRGWRQEANVLARRRHALWLAEHYPESDVWADWPILKGRDPEGYLQARPVWLGHLVRRDANGKVLANAAEFFWNDDKPQAAQALIRAIAKSPTGGEPRDSYRQNRSLRLGFLYGVAISRDGDAPFAREARQKLADSRDAGVLAAAGMVLVRIWRPEGPDADLVRLGRSYYERAAGLDSPFAREARAALQDIDRPPTPTIPDVPRAQWPALLAQSTGGERLRHLAAIAEANYVSAAFFDWRARQPADRPVGWHPQPDEREQQRDVTQDKRRAAERFAESKQAAADALALGATLKDTDGNSHAMFRAHIAAGLLAWRAGNRKDAVRHLLEASKLPKPSEASREPRSPLEAQLVNYLMKYGERESIIEYYERAAESRDENQRRTMLDAAAAIRDGRMPEPYQRYFAGGQL